MRKLMAAVTVAVVLAVGGCKSSGSGTPAPVIPNPGTASTSQSATITPSPSAPASETASTGLDSATVAALRDLLNDSEKYRRGPDDAKSHQACEALADQYDQLVKKRKITPDELGAELLPPNLDCKAY